MATQSAEIAAPLKKRGLNAWDSPWLNSRLLAGAAMVGFVVLLGVFGPLFWDTTQARAASSPLNLPPVWLEGGNPAHPLGTENSGRDMLALIITGAPASLRVGVIAAGVGVIIGCILGFSAGFLGGWVDATIRIISDAMFTIPSLAILIVIAAYVKNIDVDTMAFLLSIFAWPAPTRLIRAQVLTLRERGYVRMARLSGVPTFSIMFLEILPNMLPYIASSLVGNISGSILAATSLEALGLGPTRIPTLGMTIFYAIRGSAVLRGMWWWWGFPILTLIVIFTGLFQIATGLDEIANPRLRGIKS
jgi:peptide/nickel transport system permease protein